MTDIVPAPAPAHPNPLAAAILHETTRHAWNLTAPGGYKQPPKGVYSHSWPRDEVALRMLKSAFGVDAPVNGADEQKRGGFPEPMQFIQELIRTGREVDREGYLRRLALQRQVSGMSNSNHPQMTLTSTWGVPYAPEFKELREKTSYYLEPVVEWHLDGTVMLSLEVLFSINRDPGGEVSGGGMASLYVIRGCDHEFEHRSGGNCYHIYTCKHCKYRYDIDSGD